MVGDMKIYLIGSLRNPQVPIVANALRVLGHKVFDDWHACGPEADDIWRNYETDRGRTYAEALEGEFANHTYEFDLDHLCDCNAAILILPAGKSAHLELGFVIGQGKRGYVLFPDGPPERWDLMYKLADGVFFSLKELLEAM